MMPLRVDYYYDIGALVDVTQQARDENAEIA